MSGKAKHDVMVETFCLGHFYFNMSDHLSNFQKSGQLLRGVGTRNLTILNEEC